MAATFEETTQVNETMIVEPDFPDHWKTRLFTALCLEYERQQPGTLDPEGPAMLVLRLWAHCQQRKAYHFPGMTNVTLAAIVRWKGDADRLRAMLEESQWLDPTPQGVLVHGWGEVNAKLISNWTNGPKGGRPRNADKPTHNPTETQIKPTAKPALTQGKPIDQIDREDRERGAGALPPRALASSPSVLEVSEAGKKIGAPADFCAHFHREKTKRRSWEKTDWVMDLEDWWKKDKPTWGQSKNAGKMSGKNTAQDKAALERALTTTTDPATREILMSQILEYSGL